MSYLITSELYLCHYKSDGTEYHLIQSKSEIQDDIRRYYANERYRYKLPISIQKLNMEVGEEVTFKEFVPKGHQRPKQKFKAQAHNIWNEIWNS